MNLIPRVGDYFALDIGADAIRVVQLGGTNGAWSLAHYAIAEIDPKVSQSDAAEDQRKVRDAVTAVISQSGIRAKDVILGIPSSKTFTTVVDLADMPAAELASTIKYQADQYIPAADQSKVDWAVLGKSVSDPQKNEILLTSASNSYIESKLDIVEGMGLNVVAMEPDTIALTRSLMDTSNMATQLIVDMGAQNTDLVFVLQGTPRLIRSVPVGLNTIVRAISTNLSVDETQALQFATKFGIVVDKLEGQIPKAAASSLDQLASEVSKSIKFYAAKYPTTPPQTVVASGYASVIPGMAEYIAGKAAAQPVTGNPWSRVRVSQGDRDKLQPLAHQFAVVIGLAQRGAL